MKYLILFLGLFSATIASAQDPRWTNLPRYDDKAMHYGFTIGFNSSGFKETVSQKYFGTDSLKGISTKYTGGFSLGFIVNLRLHDHFDLRLLPTVGFYGRSVDYQFTYTSKLQSIESTFMEFPLLLKYKSQRRGNTRMYVVGGLKTAFEAGAKKKQRKQSDLRTNGFDLCFEYGFGFDFYFPLFKFSPEIRMSHGLTNLLSNDPNIYAESLTKLTSHTISLYLHFE